MKMNNWNLNIKRVLDWMQSTENDITQESVAINAILSLAEGTTDEDILGTYWVSIRSIGGSVEDFPKARVGHAPSLPDEIYMNVDSVTSHIRSAFASTFDEVIAGVILPRGQHERYTASTFGDAMADKAKSLLVKSYKDGRWDGTLDENGASNILLIEKEEATE